MTSEISSIENKIYVCEIIMIDKAGRETLYLM